jgi:streptomycin 6-kinase
VLRRFDRLVEALDLDVERARGWTVAQTLAWSTDGDWPWYAGNHQVARWLLDHR